MSRRSDTLCATLVCLMLTSCSVDALYLNDQDVTLSVMTSSDESPATDADVSLAVAGRTGDGEEALSGDEFIDLFPTQVGVTDVGGLVTIPVISSTRCGFSLVGECDPFENQVEGRAYLIRIETAAESEIFEVVFREGEIAIGQHFSVTVISVAEARPTE